MTTEQYQIGYEAGYSDGFDEAVKQPDTTAREYMTGYSDGKQWEEWQPVKPVEPEGFVLVPTKLTEAMEDAAMGYVYQHGFTRGDGPAGVYKAMLAAAKGGAL